ncbi:hypothetical protein DFJ74DRAFT_56910 [Hyaloraphidium curvatum]|nr:hypothetical protein DFJ74DRAFT_56910 [Hyaloraphidium curvatum]
MADPLATLKSLSSSSRVIKNVANLITGAKKSCLQLANRWAECIGTLEAQMLKLQQQGISMDPEAESAVRGGLMRLNSAQQVTLKYLTSLQPRNVVENLLNLADDMRQRKIQHESIAEIQMAIQKELIRTMCFATEHGDDASRRLRQEMYNLEDDLTAAADRMEDAIAEDEEKWLQVARERKNGMEEGGRENLAIQLQVPFNKLSDEIRKLKEAVKTMEDGDIRDFLKKALADYRTSRTLTSMNVTVDIAFMVDCTGSMTTLIGYTKKIVSELLGELQKSFPHVNVRMAFIGYRDFDDRGRPNYEVIPFGTVEAVAPQLQSVQALSGFGGDWAEDVLGGLKKAIALDWRSDSLARVLIHILDAPPHGKMFRDVGRSADRYYEDDKPDPAGIKPSDYRDILSELCAIKKVHYFFFPLNKTTRGTEELFAKHVQTIHDGVFNVIHLEAQANQVPDYAAFLQQVMKSTNDSMYASFSRMNMGNTLDLPADA